MIIYNLIYFIYLGQKIKIKKLQRVRISGHDSSQIIMVKYSFKTQPSKGFL